MPPGATISITGKARAAAPEPSTATVSSRPVMNCSASTSASKRAASSYAAFMSE
ncbi:Uncharacterised protein [Bordetella pertussis]|nr:Uncharacterised protein [Bordetella pertussis]